MNIRASQMLDIADHLHELVAADQYAELVDPDSGIAITLSVVAGALEGLAVEMALADLRQAREVETPLPDFRIIGDPDLDERLPSRFTSPGIGWPKQDQQPGIGQLIDDAQAKLVTRKHWSKYPA